MITPQEITEKGFVKAVFNGYDMGSVDEFLETVANDYNALYKENAILKGKLKVLVEKVEEYRSTEDAMRMALLTAQRMGEEITVEANRNKDEMLKSAEDEIKNKLSDTAKRITEEETRLALAAKETAKFIELSQAIMRKHGEFLDKLEAVRRAAKPKADSRQAASGSAPAAKATRTVKPAAPVKATQQPPPPNPAQPVAQKDAEIDDIANQIGSVVEQLTDDVPSANREEIKSRVANGPPPSLFEDDDGSVKLFDNDDEEDSETSPRPKFDFDDLKFGANFDGDE